MGNDDLSASHEKDLARLARQNRRHKITVALLKSVGILLVLLLTGLTALYFVNQYGDDPLSRISVDRRLLSLRAGWADTFVSQRQAYDEWILRHGIHTEQVLFESIADALAKSVLEVGESAKEPEKLNLGSRILVSVYSGFLRLGFLVIASFRVWVVAILLASVWGARIYRPHMGADILGQMGNGRIFYSGVRAGLDKVTDDGIPNTQIVGLACPEAASASEVHSSSIWAVLGEFDAANPTNQALAAIIIKHADWQAYVPPSDEEQLYEQFFSGSTLAENTACILRSTLMLHALYAAGATAKPPLDDDTPSNLQSLSSDDYGRLLKRALHQVLVPDLRQAIGSVAPSIIATTVLAYEAAKALAFSFEGGRWLKRSSFPHLSARAVLHSVPAYADDYDYSSRQMIRRGLIYASRHSPFAPVRLPVDLSTETFALRQWVELLTACPHQLESVADEVELVGAVRFSHEAWARHFLDSAVALSPDIARSSYATPTNLLLVPMIKVLGIMRQSFDHGQLRRLEQLVQIVSTRQKLDSLAAQSSDNETIDVSSIERLPPPLTQEERDTLGALHGLAADDLRDWSTFRVILNSYGWLARRVGEYSVPESSIIFAVLKCEVESPDANELGLVGRSGMIPFRGTRLQERWGRTWASRFVPVRGATMAEKPEDYERLLKGIDDRELHEESEPESVSAMGAQF